MARSDRRPDPPQLFDLPLHEPAAGATGDRESSSQLEADFELVPAGLFPRLRAAAADLALHAVAAAAAALIGRMLGGELEGDAVPALGLFVLPFSFFYSVVPLFFFGRTAGMRWAGLWTRSSDGLSLTLGQAVRRWLVGLAFAGLAGLPLLLFFDKRSLADRWTGSQTLRRISR